MTETFSNFAQTNLTNAINNTTTSITVDSATGFPGSGPYRITVDAEIMLVTAGFGTTSWTVTRGQESTTAVSHNAGAAVAQTLTALGLTNAVDDRITTAVGSGGAVTTAIQGFIAQGAIASRPASATNGKLYFDTDSMFIGRDNGTSWDAYGPIWKCTTPNITGWTWMNQGSFGSATQYADFAQIGDTGGQSTTDEYRVLKTTIPSPSSNWTFESKFIQTMYPNGNGSYAGIAVANSADNKTYMFIIQYDSTISPNGYGYVYTGQNGTPVGTAYNSPTLKGIPTLAHFKITKDASNITFYVSKEGLIYKQVYQVALGSSYVGSAPDWVGYTMNNYSTSAGQASWQIVLHHKLS